MCLEFRVLTEKLVFRRERKRTSKNAFVQISICCSPKLVRLVHIVQLLCSFFILFDRAFLVHNEEKYVCIVFFFDLLMSVVYVMHFPICIGHLICTRVYRLKWRALATASAAGDGASSAGCRRRAYASGGGHWYVRC